MGSQFSDFNYGRHFFKNLQANYLCLLILTLDARKWAGIMGLSLWNRKDVHTPLLFLAVQDHFIYSFEAFELKNEVDSEEGLNQYPDKIYSIWEWIFYNEHLFKFSTNGCSCSLNLCRAWKWMQPPHMPLLYSFLLATTSPELMCGVDELEWD